MQFRLIPVAVARLGSLRLDARPLLDSVGLSEQASTTGPLYLPLGRVKAFLDGCAELSGDRLFGWNLARHVALGTYGLNEFAMRTAGDLASGIEAVCKYGSLVNGLTTFTATVKRPAVHFGFLVAGAADAMGRQLNEYTMHYLLRVVSSFGDTVPSRVDFSHAPDGLSAAHLEAMQAVVRGPVEFERSRCAMEVPLTSLTNRSPLSDAGLHDFLQRQLVAAFEVSTERDVVRGVRDVLSSRLGRATLTIGPVAKQVAMSVRSLQRALEHAGTSYQEVVDLVRQERGRELLLTELSFSDVASRLGYTEATAFTHAFRRWTGLSPREYRARARAPLPRAESR